MKAISDLSQRDNRRSHETGPTPTANALLTADQVASLLGVPKSWVYEQSRNERIPTVTLGRYRRYRWAAIEAWIAAIETPGPA